MLLPAICKSENGVANLICIVKCCTCCVILIFGHIGKQIVHATLKIN